VDLIYYFEQLVTYCLAIIFLYDCSTILCLLIENTYVHVARTAARCFLVAQ